MNFGNPLVRAAEAGRGSVSMLVDWFALAIARVFLNCNRREETQRKDIA